MTKRKRKKKEKKGRRIGSRFHLRKAKKKISCKNLPTLRYKDFLFIGSREPCAVIAGPHTTLQNLSKTIKL
jgi:hypothetical protein